jgi:hypothetical protein
VEFVRQSWPFYGDCRIHFSKRRSIYEAVGGYAMTDRELLQMALDALEAHADIGIKATKQIEALRARLAQPEPVIYARKEGDLIVVDLPQVPTGGGGISKREWVGLTDSEKKDICQEAANEDWTDLDVINATEAKLKDKT